MDRERRLHLLTVLCLVFASVSMVLALATLLVLGSHPLLLADHVVAFACFLAALLLNIHTRMC